MKCGKNNQGFTLIEMLVVITVIGILSSMLLNALGPARDKAKDSRIIQEVNQVRALAETLYDGDYDALETLPKSFESIANNYLRTLAEDIAKQGGNLNIRKTLDGLNFIAYSPLNIKLGPSENSQINYYCVDNRGRAVFTTADLSFATECPQM
jgi:prepilin-type N-terminal cleavage/methylation domain-containing protein